MPSIDRRWVVAVVALAALGVGGCECSSRVDPGDGGTGPDGSSDDAGDLDGEAADGASGDAGPPCPGAGERRCGATCVAILVDPLNCGACGTACAAGEVCVSGGCSDTCPPGLDACAGTCVDSDTDSAHCGACDDPCGAGEGCVAGSCVTSVPVGPPPAVCAGGGPPIVIGGEDGTCAGAVSAATFTHGLCACRDIGVPSLGSALVVDGYDSSIGPYVPGGPGGHVGAEGHLRTSSRMEASGDLEITGPMGLEVRGRTTVGRHLRVDGDLLVASDLEVGGDALVGGAVGGGSPATIAGTLRTPDCASVPASVGAAACASEPVDVAPPCPCDPAEILPIGAIVGFYALPANNGNAAIGLAADALADVVSPTRLDLPCGVYHLDRISAGAPTVIAVHGRTAIVISGSIEIGSSLAFALDPAATLDVFVEGTLRSSGGLRVGTPAYPRESRVYVGGVCDRGAGACTLDADCCSLDCAGGACAPDPSAPEISVSLTSAGDLSGLLYAPNGQFRTSSSLEMYGALVVGDFSSGSEALIHYDAAAARTGEDCPPPPEMPDGGMPVDAGPPPDGSVPRCETGAPSCGPGTPACDAAGGFYCLAGCCTYFG